MQNQVLVWAALIAGAVCSPAYSQEGSPVTLPRLEEIRPLDLQERPLFHGVTLSLEQGYSFAADVGQATNLRQNTWQTALGLSALIGDYGFASVTGVYSSVSLNSTNVAFGMPMAAGGSVLGADAVVGLRPLPVLSIGLLGGYGSGFASYTFVGFPGPATPALSSSSRSADSSRRGSATIAGA